jgi:hypothetical protein
MTKFDDKVNGNTVDASEYNDQVRSNKNAILAGGIAITSDNDQLAKSIVNHVGAANYYTDSGAANAYVLNTVGDFKAPTQLDAKTDGLLIRFRAANASTTASTVNVAGLGVKNIKLADGTTDITTEIATNKDTFLRYDFGNDVFQYVDLTPNAASETVAGIAEIATQAEVDAGTDDARIITPLKYLSGFANSKTTNGYTYLPNGLIFQWGNVTAPSNSSAVFNFPIAFPNQAFQIAASTNNPQPAATNGNSCGAYVISTAQYRAFSDDSSKNVTWIAVGY